MNGKMNLQNNLQKKRSIFSPKASFSRSSEDQQYWVNPWTGIFHPSTSQAHRCSTSVIIREQPFPRWLLSPKELAWVYVVLVHTVKVGLTQEIFFPLGVFQCRLGILVDLGQSFQLIDFGSLVSVKHRGSNFKAQSKGKKNKSSSK